MTPCFKAVQRTRLTPDLTNLLLGPMPPSIKYVCGGRTITLGPPQRISDMIRRAMGDLLNQTGDAARVCADEWMVENSISADRLHNVYVELSSDCREVVTTWTFADRDAALLFRLSLD